ncbi:TetR/AcrR family transcriptional regulator [Rhizosaccharibacter radicis]|uniref:TetR/AcrR family transcriptional regulator n=1 Tax=Rhizosaccharibacter radicis TaxID=2782605 RepID=A0ABT1W0F3_9PROT|nr:TetR/AcrR family transcriptional regulator [Acetobacteraceae bacterium KSS12]
MDRTNAAASAHTSTTAARRPRARATQAEERPHLLLNAAEEVFMQKGFHLTTMDAVAERAGMSKKTIYQLFESKQDLFEAVMHRHAPMSAAFDPPADGPVEGVLEALVLSVALPCMAPKHVSLTQLFIAECRANQDLMPIFYRMEMRHETNILARWLSEHAARAGLDVDDPQDTAHMLLAGTIGDLFIKALLGKRPFPSEAYIRRRARLAVQTFLHGTARRPTTRQAET